MKLTFFKALFAMLFGAKGQVEPINRRQIIRNPRLQRMARNMGNKRRLAQHRQTCEDGYRAKIALVRDGVGSHSVAGIPAGFIPDDLKEARA